MAADNPFRDDFLDENPWEDFDDYECVLADAAANTGNQSNDQNQQQTMSLNELQHFQSQSQGITFKRTSSIASTNSRSSTGISRLSCPSPPPLNSSKISSAGITAPRPSVDDQLNQEFWHDLFDEPTKITKDSQQTNKVRSSNPQKSSIKSPRPNVSVHPSLVEQVDRPLQSPLAPTTKPSKSSKKKRKRRKSKKSRDSGPKSAKSDSAKSKTSVVSRVSTTSNGSSSSFVHTPDGSDDDEKQLNEDVNDNDSNDVNESNEPRKSQSARLDQPNRSNSSSSRSRGLTYCRDQARRRSSYRIAFAPSTFNEETFDVKKAMNVDPVNLFEIGKIIDTLRGKANGWLLQSYLMTYQTSGCSSPIFEISHPEKGTHLVLGVYPRLKEVTTFLKHHPLIPLMEEYGVTKCYTPVRYSKRSGFNYSLQTVVTTTISNVEVESLKVVDEEYQIINREFHKQCEKLFDKILYGKGDWKKIPGVDSVFITHWNTFMRKYRAGVEMAYLKGDLKAYILLVSMFWSVVLRFKKQNRCKDLSKVLSRRMSYKVIKELELRLNEKHTSITMVSLNLLFRPNGLFGILKEKGWDVHLMDEDKIQQYRARNYCNDTGELRQSIFKVAKHAGKVMSWSRNRESCLVM